MGVAITVRDAPQQVRDELAVAAIGRVGGVLQCLKERALETNKETAT